MRRPSSRARSSTAGNETHSYEDLCCGITLEVSGEKDGRERTLRWDLLDRYDERTRITAMMRTTGFSLTITAQLQAEGRVPPGVWTPDEAVPAEPYIAALAERGVRIEETTD